MSGTTCLRFGSDDQNDNPTNTARELVNHVAIHAIKQSTITQNDVTGTTGLTIAIAMATPTTTTDRDQEDEDRVVLHNKAMKIAAQIFCGKSDLIGSHLALLNSLWVGDDVKFGKNSKSTLAVFYNCEPQRLPMKHNKLNERKLRRKLHKLNVSGTFQDHINAIQFENSSINAGIRERILLTSSVHVSSEWREPFSRHSTTNTKFNTSQHEIVQAAMMSQKSGLIYVTCDVIRCDVIEVPLQARRLSMLFYLPHESGGLAFLENHLTVRNFSEILEQIKKTKPRPVHFSVPKFALSNNEEMSEKIMKFQDISTDVVKTKNFQLYHSMMLVVNEQGLNVPECTAHEQTMFGPAVHDGLRWTTVIMNRPFLFTLVDMASGMIFSVGKVSTPQLNVTGTPYSGGGKRIKRKWWCF